MSKIRKIMVLVSAIAILGISLPFNVMAETLDTNIERLGGVPKENAWERDDFTYEDGGKTITGFSEKGKEKLETNKDLVIPDGVEIIRDRAFSYTDLISLTISDSVTTIGNSAFAYNHLTSISLPDSVTTIGDRAFERNNLTSIIIPKSVTTIGNIAFENNKLTSLTIPDSITTIGVRAFAYNKLTSLTIPDSLTTIRDSAFAFNNLTSISIPDSVKIIEYNAFLYNHITSITIPDSVTTIGDGAFRYNDITSITIPDSVTTIGEGAFADNRLTNISIPDSVTTIEKGAFANQICYFNPKQNPFTLKEVGISLTGRKEEINDISSFVYYYIELNNEKEKLSFPKDIQKTDLQTEIIPDYQYSIQHMVIYNPGKYVKDIGTITPVPVITKENMEEEIVPWGKTIDLTDNIKNLPKNSVIKDTTEPKINTKKSGEYIGKVEITFENGSKRIVNIPVIVNKSEAETYQPQYKHDILEIDKNDLVSLEERLINKPKFLEITEIKPIDTNTEGKKQGIIKIKFKDGSEKEYTVDATIKFKNKQSNNENNQPNNENKSTIPTITTNDFRQGEIKIIDNSNKDTETKPNTDTIRIYEKDGYKDYWVFKVNDLDYKFVTPIKIEDHAADLAPYIQQDRTMLPFRYVGNALNIETTYDNKTRTATFKQGNDILQINIDNKKATKNGKPYELEVDPILKRGRLVAPVSVIGKAFNKTISNYNENKNTDIVWNQETQEVVFYKYK